MLESLPDFENYSSFSSRVRCLDAQMRSLGLADLNQQTSRYLREVGCLQDLSKKLQMYCSLCEYSRVVRVQILQMSSEISALCSSHLETAIESGCVGVDANYVVKLLGMLNKYSESTPAQAPVFVNNLLHLINHLNCSSETGLICGNSLLLVLVRTYAQEELKPVLANIIQDNSKPFTQMCILTGLLSVASPSCLSWRSCGSSTASSSNSSGSTAAASSLLFEYLPLVLQLCASGSSFSFQNFSLLKLWSLKTKEILTHPNSSSTSQEGEATELLELHPDLVEQILQLCQGNFENPNRGVPDLCKEIYRNLLLAARDSWEPSTFSHLLCSIVDSTIKAKWSHKSKYFKLLILVPLVGLDRVVPLDPGFGVGLSTSLQSNHTTHAGVEVYKLCLGNEYLWKSEFASILCGNLLSENVLLRQNTRDHWLPSTLETIPSSHQTMEVILAGSTQASPELVLLAQLDILRICRRLGRLQELTSAQSASLHQGLIHSSPEVRSAAFSSICETKKRGSVPSGEERDLVIQFISNNCTEDSTKFRQCVLSAFSLLMIRCRDHCAQVIRNMKKHGGEGPLGLAQFLNEIMVSLLRNLLPGGNYQRKIFSLQLLNIFIDNFVKFNGSGANKCSGNGDPSRFLEFARSHSLLGFGNQQHLQILLLNVEDKMGDVRDLSGNILNLFSPNQPMLEQIYQRAMSLLTSPKDRLCESGATLLKLISFWTQQSSGDLNCQHTRDSSICEQLLEKYERTFSRGNDDFLAAALLDPLHGTITGLRLVLLDMDSTQRLSFDQHSLERLVSVLERSTSTMLAVLSGSMDAEEHNPSFEESARAISRIIENSEHSFEGEGEDPTIPESHQLVLSAVWQNIKGCALLAGELVSSSTLELEPHHSSPNLNPHLVQRCGDLLMKILTFCRHKGALEGTVQACGSYASKLVNSRIKEYTQITTNMLQRVFLHIEQSADSSVTRRSAGLPGLVQALVAAEASVGANSGELLQESVSRLTQLASVTGDVELKDSTASHALHILRGIVQDAAVSRHIGPYTKTIAKTCLQSFESANWSERNAALQLFGAIAPRILGQKKLRTESSEHNKVRLEEVVVRFPGLVDLLLDELNQTSGKGLRLVSASVVPILTLLARLERSTTREQDKLTECESAVYLAVSSYLASPVIQVRQLAALISAEFMEGSPAQLLNLATNQDTNYLHGVLCVLRHRLEAVVTSSRDVKLVTDRLHQIYVGSSCLIIRSLILDLGTRLKMRMDEYPVASISGEQMFHPGYVAYSDALSKPSPEIQSICDLLKAAVDSSDRSAVFHLLDALQCRSGKISQEGVNIGDLVDVLGSLLVDASDDQPIISLALQLLNSDWVVSEMNNNPEIAIDLLETIKNGLSLSGQSLEFKLTLLKSNCLNAQLIQEDWAWFFGDTSEYVAVFVENTERILEQASPTLVEDSRLNAAACLTSLAPCMKKRKIRGSMTPLLQYGLINLLNAALTLLEDEDVDVRMAATQFSSILKRSSFLPHSPEISTPLGTENIVYYGLSECTEVLEMFTPVLSLINATHISYTPENARSKIHTLFKRGDGVNVYSEPVFRIKTYYTCIRTQCDKEMLGLSVNIGQLIEMGNCVLSQLEKETESAYPGYLYPAGFEVLLRLQALLELVSLQGFLKQPPTQAEKEQIEEVRGRLSKFIPLHLL